MQAYTQAGTNGWAQRETRFTPLLQCWKILRERARALVKTNHLGEQVWNRTFGDTRYDIGYGVQQTSDNGYIIVGQTRTDEQQNEIWLIKTDSNGYMQWNRTFGGIGRDYGYHVQQTPDGGYVLTGESTSQGVGGQGTIWVIKTDSSGVETWNRYFGGSRNDGGKVVQRTSDSGYVVLGYTENFGEGSGEVCLLKFNSEGDLRWSNTFGGTGFDIGYSMKQTSDGGYIISGKTDSYGDVYRDVYLIKTNASGAIEWSYTIGGEGAESGDSVAPTRDGGYIVAGLTDSFGAGDQDIYLVKMKSILSPREYSIDVDALPSLVTEGDAVSIAGSTEPPLTDQTISLVIDGSIAQSSTTDGSGDFSYNWVFDTYGTHSVAVTVHDSKFVHGSTSAPQEIRVNAKPEALFEYSPSDVRANEAVYFTDLSTDVDGVVVSWLWDYGNGMTSTSQDPFQSFAVGGGYEVSLVVTDSDGTVSDPFTLVVEIGDEIRAGTWIAGSMIPPDLRTDEEIWVIVQVNWNFTESAQIKSSLYDVENGVYVSEFEDTVTGESYGHYNHTFTTPSTPGFHHYITEAPYLSGDEWVLGIDAKMQIILEIAESGTVIEPNVTRYYAGITGLTYPADVLRGDEVSIEVSVDYDFPGALRLIVEVNDETDTLDSVSEEVSWQGSGEYTLGFTAPSTPGNYDYVVTVTYIADDIADISEGGVEEFTIRVRARIGIPGFPPVAIFLGLFTVALLLRAKSRLRQ